MVKAGLLAVGILRWAVLLFDYERDALPVSVK